MTAITGLQRPDAAQAPSGPAERYLDLLERCLTRLLFFDEEVTDVDPGHLGLAPGAQELLAEAIRDRGVRLVRGLTDRKARENGRDWPFPAYAETMVGVRRLHSIRECVTNAVRDGVPGDLAEAGVWRGGAAILMRAVLAAYGDTNRRVWVADSFEGVPRSDAARYPDDAGLEFISDLPGLAVGMDSVKANFDRYGLLDEQVVFLPGWFKDTLPGAPIEKLAVVRIDGDLYESTMDAISALYPRLSVGGYLIIDDYNDIRACRRAVSDYRVEHGITEKIQPVDWTGVYWRKLHA